MPEKIGFIGLGIMGKPMAHNLMKAGYELVVSNRSQAPMDELAAEGAITADKPKAVAEQSNIVITMLPDSPQVWEVVTGEEGVLAGAKAGTLVIDMSTISPVVTQDMVREAQARGVQMLDAPVSGGDVAAQQGTLSIMVGGSAEDFEQAKPLFRVEGDLVVRTQMVAAGGEVPHAVRLATRPTDQATVSGRITSLPPSALAGSPPGGRCRWRA